MAELPEFIEEVRVLRPEPDDVFVLRISSDDRDAQMQASEWMEALFPVNRVMILGPSEELNLVRKEQNPALPG